MKLQNHDIMVSVFLEHLYELNVFDEIKEENINNMTVEYLLASNGFIHGYIDLLLELKDKSYCIIEFKTKDEDPSIGDAIRQLKKYEYYLKYLNKDIKKIYTLLIVHEYPDHELGQQLAEKSGIYFLNLR